ncbi:MAG: hypothetical protein AABX39_04250 [Nanoarchaeota archaeon]
MTDLIVFLGEGKGTWGHVMKVVEDSQFSKIYVITQEFFKDKITIQKEHEKIVLNAEKPLSELISELKKYFQDKVFGDIAVNMFSGSGKEHMALLSALLQVGAGVRLIALTQDGVKEV